ncbi:MAG: permease [Candidatus Methanomethylicaceae archaeon]
MNNNLKSLAVMGLIALVLVILAYRKSPGTAAEGFIQGGKLFLTIFPNLLVGFILAGMIMVLIPREAIVKWVGEESGWRGLIIATILGSVTPGGPFAQFPLVASLYQKGAGIGQVAAYLTSWSILGFNRIIVYEWPFMGIRFVLLRVGTSLIIPSLVGIIVSYLNRHIH